MEHRIVDHYARCIAAVAAVMVVVVTALYGARAGIGAAAGGAVALANWGFLRWLVRRIARAKSTRQRALSMLLVVKLTALIGVCFVLLRWVGVDEVGFAFGVSSLVVALVFGSFLPGARPDDEGDREGPSSSDDVLPFSISTTEGLFHAAR